MFQYIRNPDEIYRRSFEILRRECNFSRIPNEIRPIAERLVHACGIPEILENLAWRGLPAETALKALNNGANILVAGTGTFKAEDMAVSIKELRES